MRNRRRRSVSPIYTFAVTWAILTFGIPVFRVGGFLLVAILCSLSAFIASAVTKKKYRDEDNTQQAQQTQQTRQTRQTQQTNRSDEVKKAKAAPVKKSYGPEIDPIIEEGNKALSEMGRLYMSIKDDDVRKKINELMRITDKITRDAIDDPSDIPQIKKFMSYYLPTTIKLLNAYDRMSSQGIEGENLDRSMKSINEMLDTAIEAYKKRLDSLFADQALDIETDIQVLNTMLAREGLAGGNDFEIKTQQSEGY